MLKEMSFANASAVVTGIIYVVCRLLVAVIPDLFGTISQSWFHNYDLSVLPPAQNTGGGLLLGLVTAVLAAWAVGYLFAWVYNRLAK